MIQAKQELLQALEAVFAQMAPGAAVPSAFESPKVAAHGDLATTAAMQLAKPLKLNPRQLAENLRASLLAKSTPYSPSANEKPPMLRCSSALQPMAGNATVARSSPHDSNHSSSLGRHSAASSAVSPSVLPLMSQL